MNRSDGTWTKITGKAFRWNKGFIIYLGGPRTGFHSTNFSFYANIYKQKDVNIETDVNTENIYKKNCFLIQLVKYIRLQN